MLNSGKKIVLRAIKEINILILVFSKKKNFWTKQKTITLLLKLNGRSLTCLNGKNITQSRNKWCWQNVLQNLYERIGIFITGCSTFKIESIRSHMSNGRSLKPVRLKFSHTNGSIIFLFPLVHLFIRFTLFRWWPFIICQNFPIAVSKCCRKCRRSSHIYFNQN